MLYWKDNFFTTPLDEAGVQSGHYEQSDESTDHPEVIIRDDKNSAGTFKILQASGVEEIYKRLA